MIVDMALDFAGMARVFSKKSNEHILPKLREFFARLDCIQDRSGYDQFHAELCNWFTQNIRTAERKGKNPIPEGSCSYGQAAKVVNISAKVYVYYCALPSSNAAQVLVPMLHAALDEGMIEHLRKRFPGAGIQARTNKAVDRDEYERLRSHVAKEIQEDFRSEIFPVQYDDITFRRLNRAPPLQPK